MNPLAVVTRYFSDVGNGSDVYELLVVAPKNNFSSKFLRWFHLKNCSCCKEEKKVHYFTKKQMLEKM